MKTLSHTLVSLLNILNDGQYHPGPVLAKGLKISRAAVNKHCKHISELGIEIEVCRQRGYRLKQAFYPLYADDIWQACESELKQQVDLHIYAELGSTNDYLKTISQRGKVVCVSERQTAGRGRLGREWQSPFGSNIYCSLKWPFGGDFSALSGMSLVVGLALIDALGKAGINDLAIKWPNDVFLQGKKLAGILIDIQAEPHGYSDVIIGFGINVNMQHNPAIDRPWIALNHYSRKIHNRNHLIGFCLSSLHDYITRFEQWGLTSFMHEWQQFDHLYGQEITLHSFEQSQRGTACGIDDQGRLRLRDSLGVISSHSSGDASLHDNIPPLC